MSATPRLEVPHLAKKIGKGGKKGLTHGESNPGLPRVVLGLVGLTGGDTSHYTMGDCDSTTAKQNYSHKMLGVWKNEKGTRMVQNSLQ